MESSPLRAIIIASFLSTFIKSHYDNKRKGKIMTLKHLKTDQIKRRQNNDRFIKNYESSKYPGMFVTADIVVLTLDAFYNPCILLIQRQSKNNYEAGLWAVPGGFVGINESSKDAAVRELQEETGIENVHIEQFATFDEPDRDRRSRVISVAYMAFVPMTSLDNMKGQDDAADAKLFKISKDKDNRLILENNTDGFYITKDDLGFDHAKIIKTALSRLDNRFTYTEDIFEFVKDKEAFTSNELIKIWKAMTNEEIDPANFRRDVVQKYLDNGIIEDTGEKTTLFSKRPATVYIKV